MNMFELLFSAQDLSSKKWLLKRKLLRLPLLVNDKLDKLLISYDYFKGTGLELENLMNRNNHLGKIVMHNVAKGLSRKLRRG